MSRKFACIIALALLGPAVGACSSDINLSSINVVPKASEVLRPDWLSFSGHKDEFTLRPAGPEDLVGPEGQCAAAPASDASDPSGEPAAPGQVQGGIALQMTECDVVRRAGNPEKVELGTNERGERSVVLTYLQGPRPGIYRFAAGRLVSIERAPQPATPARHQKAAPARKRT